MKRTLVGAFVLLGGLTVGCDVKSPPVRLNFWHELPVVGVNTQDAAEVQAALTCETAHVNYLHRLNVLSAYYDRVGNKDRLDWTRRELTNAQEAQWFAWQGIPAVSEPAGESVVGVDERMLVEALAEARNSYVRSLRDLYAFYEPKDRFKAKVIRRVQERLDVVRVYSYYFEAEIPGPDLTPSRFHPEAEQLFDQALDLHRTGKRLPLLPAYQKQRRALMMFHEVIKKYPDSTRISLAAFYMGEIYKEYFNENVRSVRWYERAWQWDPTIPLPARFQAAVIYDLRLGDREKAIELYREVLKHEPFNQSNIEFTQKRLQELQPRQDRAEGRQETPPAPPPAPEAPK